MGVGAGVCGEEQLWLGMPKDVQVYEAVCLEVGYLGWTREMAQ